MTQQLNEFDLISEIHISLLPDLQKWEVKAVEPGYFSYPVDLYEDVNTAFEGARVIHGICKQSVAIKIIGENGDTVAVDCEKLTKLEIVAMANTAYIYFNKKRNRWEIAVSDIHSNYIIPDLQTEEDANAYGNLFQAINPNCQVVNERDVESSDIADNTCRARDCIRNINDACILQPRNASLPLPAVDPSFDTWTELNNPIPRSCLNYSSEEDSAEGVDGE